MNQHRDSIDFAKENIPRLFLRLFVPTFLGLLFGAMLNIADGIFVGQGVGSDALAAVNVAAPIFMIGTGTVLLLPPLAGNAGLWLAVPVSEAITLVVLLGVLGEKSWARRRAR